MSSAESAEAIRAEVGAILRVEPSAIDIEANLFDLGLNSLTFLRVVSSLKRKFNLSLDLVTVWENPSIACLSLALAHRTKGDVDDE